MGLVVGFARCFTEYGAYYWRVVLCRMWISGRGAEIPDNVLKQMFAHFTLWAWAGTLPALRSAPLTTRSAKLLPARLPRILLCLARDFYF